MRFLDASVGIAMHQDPYLRVLKDEVQVVQGRGDFFSQGRGGQFGGLAALIGTG
ncbi:hypothetical protein D3C76_1578480 [compost metagenome]